jgi:hypothetical protein
VQGRYFVDDEVRARPYEQLDDCEVADRDRMEKWEIAAENKTRTGLSMFGSAWKSRRSWTASSLWLAIAVTSGVWPVGVAEFRSAPR